jgi:hypothetical protein
MVFVAVGLVAALAVGAIAYRTWFAPEESTRAMQEFPDLGAPTTNEETGDGLAPQPLRQGAFAGADSFHYASGSVALHQAANGTYVLRFEDYDARNGPDVYLYLTRNAGDRSTQAVESEGLRLVVPGGEGDGRATVRGTFNLYLPAGTDALAYGGITIWCDQFNEFFGHAPLA